MFVNTCILVFSGLSQRGLLRRLPLSGGWGYSGKRVGEGLPRNLPEVERHLAARILRIIFDPSQVAPSPAVSSLRFPGTRSAASGYPLAKPVLVSKWIKRARDDLH
jgi:hypothetical protein